MTTDSRVPVVDEDLVETQVSRLVSLTVSSQLLDILFVTCLNLDDQRDLGSTNHVTDLTGPIVPPCSYSVCLTT